MDTFNLSSLSLTVNRVAFLMLMLAGFWSTSSGQATKCGEFICLPKIFAEYPKASFIDRIYNDSQKIQSIDLVAVSNAEPWVVFSDRSNNTLYQSPDGVANRESLGFMEQAMVGNVQGNWLELHTATYDGSGKAIFRNRGWMNAKFLILSRQALTNEQATPQKALILVSVANLKPVEASMEIMEKKFYDFPNSQGNANGKEAKRMEIYFILKEASNMLLLSRSDKLANLSDIGLRADVPGWIPKGKVTSWDHRVCLELAYGAESQEAYNGLEIPIFSSKTSMDYYKRTLLYLKDSVVKKHSVGVKRQNPNIMRMPILHNFDDVNKRVATIASLRDSLNGVVAVKIERAKAKASDVNILFVVDGTLSMKNYYQPIAKSIATIVENSKKIKSDNKIKMGLAVYRDYKDGDKAYQYYPLTDNYERFIGQVMSVECGGVDTDLPEAPYNGLIKGMDDAFTDPSQSNVVVLVGDAGNTIPDAKGKTLEQVVERLHKYEASLVAFQVNYLSDPTYLDFNTDMSKLMLFTARKYLAGKEKLARLEKLADINTLKLKFESEGNGREDSYFMFGRFTYASGQSAMPVSIFESNVSISLNEYLDKVNRLKAMITVAGTGNGRFEPEFIDYLRRRGFSASEIQVLKQEGDISTTGVTATSFHEREEPCFTPVAFMSAGEKDVIDKLLTKLVNEPASASDKRVAFMNALKAQCTRILGNQSEDLVDNKTLDEIWDLILAIPFSANRTLASTQLRKLPEIDQTIFDRFYNDFIVAASKFIRTDYTGESRFKMADTYFFWIPLEDIPGCKAN